MCHRLGHREGGEPPLGRALGITEAPQSPRLNSQGRHGRVYHENLWPAVALGVVRGSHPSRVRRHTRVSSGPHASGASGEFGEQTELVASELCREVENLPGKRRRGIQIWLVQMIEPQPDKTTKELGGV